MTYRSLMVQLDLADPSDAALRITCELADLFKAEVIGIAAGFPTAPVHADGMIATSVLEANYEELQRDLARCEGRFRAALTPLGIPAHWRSEMANPAEFLAAQSRAADLIIVGRHRDRSILLPQQALDIGDTVMRAGRPMLLVPPGMTSLAFNRLMVAWKDTAESRRAVAAALPLLKLAGEVRIIEIVSAESEERDAAARIADVAAWLQRHGVAASATVEKPAGDAGSHLDLLAAQNKADIVIAGAYGHSRIREWALGGVTRHFIRHAATCTFLMH